MKQNKKGVVGISILLSILLGLVVVVVITIASISKSSLSNSRAQTASLGTIGVLSDSYTDEYRADDNRGGAYGRNTLSWLELLIKYRNINAGQWGNWGGPRRTGYEYNWSRTGATTASIISTGMHTGLAQQVRDNKIDAVFYMAGPNDFLEITPAIYGGTLTGSQLDSRIAGFISNVDTATSAIKQAKNIPVVILTMTVDFDIHPQGGSLSNPTGRQRVSDAIAKYNNGLKNLASQKGHHILELSPFYPEIKNRLDSQGNIIVGSEEITYKSVSEEPHHLFLSDRTHLGTVANGLLANIWISEVNRIFGGSIAIFTDNELLANAGISVPTNVPTVNPTAAPTSTPVVTKTPTPISTPTNSPTPRPTFVPGPTFNATPRPTATPVASSPYCGFYRRYRGFLVRFMSSGQVSDWDARCGI